MNVPDTPNPTKTEDGSSASPTFMPITPDRLHSSEASLPPLLHVSAKGEILWASSPALSLLRTYWGWTTETAHLPNALRRMVGRLSDGNELLPPRLRSQLLVARRQGASLLVRLIEDNKRLWLLLDERSSSIATHTHGLTKREAEVFQWLAAGKSNKDIGTILDISPRTVEKHLERIFQHLGVETRTAAAAEFYRLSQNHRTSSHNIEG